MPVEVFEYCDALRVILSMKRKKCTMLSSLAFQYPTSNTMIRAIFTNYSAWNKVQWLSSPSINFSVIQFIQVDIFNGTDLAL